MRTTPSRAAAPPDFHCTLVPIRGAMEADVRLAADYIHPFRSVSGLSSRCRIRVYVPEEESDAPVVICSELPNNPGPSITNSVESIAAQVIRGHHLEIPVWIEHHPKEATVTGKESFELVIFSDYEVREVVRHRGPRLEIGQPTGGLSTVVV